MRDLAVLVPSRGRPHNMQRLIRAMQDTCHADTQLVVGVDADDPCLPIYFDVFDETEVHIQPPMRLVPWLNYLSASRVDEYRAIGHIGDDNVPRTHGWDVRIMESLDTHNMCFGDDLDPGRVPGSLTIHAFMRSEMIRTLGYMGPPALRHMYVDPVWFAWGTATSIEFLPDVVLEHMHYSIGGKAPRDESYEASTGLIPEDCVAYNAYCADGLNADIVKLGGEPWSPEQIEQFNQRLNIPKAWGQ